MTTHVMNVSFLVETKGIYKLKEATFRMNYLAVAT